MQNQQRMIPLIGKVGKKDGFGQLGLDHMGGLPPLKETFVGSLEILSSSLGYGFIVLTFPV